MHLITIGTQHMQIMDIFAQVGGLKSMASELGISETQVASGASALLPAVAGGLGGAVSGMLGGMMGGGDTGSSGGLVGMIDMNGDGNALDDIMRMAGKAMGR